MQHIINPPQHELQTLPEVFQARRNPPAGLNDQNPSEYLILKKEQSAGGFHTLSNTPAGKIKLNIPSRG